MLLTYLVKYNEQIQSNISMKDKTCTIVIPARMGSSRLPNKPLKEIAGKPLLKWVIELAQNINFEASLIVLTEDKLIKDFVDSLGVECYLTDKFHKNGTARILEILDSIDSDFFINLQGDEPLIQKEHLENLITAINRNPDIDSWNSISDLNSEKELNDINIVKAALNEEGQIIYFFRKSPSHAKFLSLIHISEPTRPY